MIGARLTNGCCYRTREDGVRRQTSLCESQGEATPTSDVYWTEVEKHG